MYNSIKWLLDNVFTDKEDNLAYSYDRENTGETKTEDLIKNGGNIKVTGKSKFFYLQKLYSSKLYEAIKSPINALLKGFYATFAQKVISVFNYHELEFIISRLPTIDIKNRENNTVNKNNNNNETFTVGKNILGIIDSFDNNEREEFLRFVARWFKALLYRFNAFHRILGINKFIVLKVFGTDFVRLTDALICINQLDLSEFTNKKILYKRVTLAIKGEKVGFEYV